MIGFFLGLALMCASTLMYEITLTRLLSVTCWYYLLRFRFHGDVRHDGGCARRAASPHMV